MVEFLTELDQDAMGFYFARSRYPIIVLVHG
jgi:hypothetical protein